MSNRLIAAALCGASLLALDVPAVSYAQQSAQPAASTGALEEIVVTARRREEKLQSVPVAIGLAGQSRLMSYCVARSP